MLEQIKLQSRKRNRMKNFDYSKNGAYFITICIQDRISYFGKIKEGKITLNKYGEIVAKTWEWLATQYPYVELGEFIVMPNHFHGIIYINSNNVVGTGRDLSTKIKPISELIGAFKTVSSKKINKDNSLFSFYWQRSFYDRVIRNEKELEKMTDYIRLNPENWEKDELFN